MVQKFTGHLSSIGFKPTGSDSSLFVYKDGDHLAYLLLYVDEIFLTASTTALLRRITNHLSSSFAVKDLGPLHFFLGMQVRRTKAGFFLNQSKYAADILDRAGMANCSPAITPVDTKPKLSSDSGSAFSDASFYCSIAGALQYT